MQLIEMKVPLCCESCARKVRKKLENMKGEELNLFLPIYFDFVQFRYHSSTWSRSEGDAIFGMNLFNLAIFLAFMQE